MDDFIGFLFVFGDWRKGGIKRLRLVNRGELVVILNGSFLGL